MRLSDSAIRVLKPRVTAYKVSDEKGLYLLVTPVGGRLWKLKFRTATGVEKKLSLGSYPDLSLKEARNRRDEARRNLANGIDPAEKKRRDIHAAKVSAMNTFTAVAEAFIAKNERDGLAPNTIANQLATSDPTRDLRGALAKRQPKHHAAILEPKRVGDLLRAIDGYEGQGFPITRIVPLRVCASRRTAKGRMARD